MRRSLFTAVVALAGLLAIVAVATPRNHPPGGEATKSAGGSGPSAGQRFVVHEWGTFTNFAGADGVQLDFRPLVDNELPAFVYDRAMQGTLWLGKGRRARQRMETPVTYFYTDRPREVSVSVEFPRGLLTEFYPPPRTVLPAYQFGVAPPLEASSLDWGNIRIVPEALFAELQIDAEESVSPPEVDGDNHYAFARETDSAIVEATDNMGQTHHEKFLFYRGLGNFNLPLRFEAHGQGRFTVTNDGAEAVHSLFLVEVAHNEVRFAQFPLVEAGRSVALTGSAEISTVDQLGARLAEALIATGLYEREALAMVKTWKSSWFGEEGTRLLYLVPERLTAEILPLRITPQPDELVRVLVGRMDVMTPERTDELARIVRDLGTCVSSALEPLRGELARLGRFAEPAMTHVADTLQLPSERAKVEALLAELRKPK
ncbi:MAG TPA: hypothetical protein VND64_06735 [Pirellulales bacterium]|nr:hypothetical protein [Pirellulales bacterium]